MHFDANRKLPTSVYRPPATVYLELPMGANVVPDGVEFRVWAPHARKLDVEFHYQQAAADYRLPVTDYPKRKFFPMRREEDGCWSAKLAAGAGTHYKYRLDGQASFPDPYSRSQPEGVHGPSEVVDLQRHHWQDAGWAGLVAQGLVIYECHVGLATAGGTFDELAGLFDYLSALGVNAVELMPVVESSGRRGWGYDGVYPFAPSRNYGGAQALQRLVDAAHQRGIGVILDVVYNHLGPEGNYLGQFSADYFTSRYETPWGQALNYDGPGSEWVRKLVLDNATSWVRDYHVDGLRFDATFLMHDASPRHVLQEAVQAARSAASGRSLVLIAETSENDVRYLLPEGQSGYGFDVIWADDFHHEVRRYLTGDHDGYYQDYQGTLQELAQTINQGFLYEGQHSRFWNKTRGTVARSRPAWQFQYCIQNHDQVGNRALGERLHHDIDLDRYRAVSSLLLLLPYTPLLFFGQEFAASAPFQFFSDHSPDLGRLVTEGRRKEFKDYAAFKQGAIPDPQAPETFQRSKPDFGEARTMPGAGILGLYQELLRLRREDAVLRRQDRFTMVASAPTENVLQVRFGNERLLLVNFGPQARVRGTESGVRSPGSGVRAGIRSWVLFQSNASEFGGAGEPARFEGDSIVLPARCAVLLANGES